MSTTISGTSGITFPDASTLAWSQNDLDYFFWGTSTSTPSLKGLTFSGDDGVLQEYNVDFTDLAPVRIRATHAADNTTNSFTIAVPTGTTVNDTVLVAMLFENNTTARPTITNFTEVTSRNGSFVGSACTHVLMVGKITDGQTTITIPNDATFGGGCATAVTLFGDQTVSATTVDTADALNSTATSDVLSDELQRRMTIWIGMIDSGTETSTAWPTDANANFTAVFVGGDSAPGRAGVVIGAYEYNTTFTFTLTTATIGTAVGSLFFRVVCTRNRE